MKIIVGNKSINLSKNSVISSKIKKVLQNVAASNKYNEEDDEHNHPKHILPHSEYHKHAMTLQHLNAKDKDGTGKSWTPKEAAEHKRAAHVIHNHHAALAHYHNKMAAAEPDSLSEGVINHKSLADAHEDQGTVAY
jgi:hypothetical protein